MAKDTVPERIAVLETEWRHLQSLVDRLESELRDQKLIVRQYLRIGGLMGAAAVMQWPGASFAETLGRFARPLLELFLKSL